VLVEIRDEVGDVVGVEDVDVVEVVKGTATKSRRHSAKRRKSILWESSITHKR
jgi:hypothetical protein